LALGLTTILTSATGFFFHSKAFGPPHVVGVISLIILAAIPLSIITAVLFIKLTGQTLNTMTLGGFALAIGILVDNGTVVIENIERHVAMREPLHQSIVVGASEVAIPTFLSTLCICIVFVPMFFLTGVARYLFVPLAVRSISVTLTFKPSSPYALMAFSTAATSVSRCQCP